MDINNGHEEQNCNCGNSVRRLDLHMPRKNLNKTKIGFSTKK